MQTFSPLPCAPHLWDRPGTMGLPVWGGIQHSRDVCLSRPTAPHLFSPWSFRNLWISICLIAHWKIHRWGKKTLSYSRFWIKSLQHVTFMTKSIITQQSPLFDFSWVSDQSISIAMTWISQKWKLVFSSDTFSPSVNRQRNASQGRAIPLTGFSRENPKLPQLTAVTDATSLQRWLEKGRRAQGPVPVSISELTSRAVFHQLKVPHFKLAVQTTTLKHIKAYNVRDSLCFQRTC